MKGNKNTAKETKTYKDGLTSEKQDNLEYQERM